MSFGMFVLGLMVMAIGFGMVYKTDWLLRNVGDLSAIVGSSFGNFLSWKLLGIIFLVGGFLVMTGLLQWFLMDTIGRFFSFGAAY
jgi:hypothetical protein